MSAKSFATIIIRFLCIYLVIKLVWIIVAGFSLLWESVNLPGPVNLGAAFWAYVNFWNFLGIALLVLVYRKSHRLGAVIARDLD